MFKKLFLHSLSEWSAKMTNQLSNLKNYPELSLTGYLNIERANYIIDIGIDDLITTNEELLATEIMEIPLEIFLSDKKGFFEQFIYQFLNFSQLCILEHQKTKSASIAILNEYNGKQIALVAWKVNNILLVFDIIKVSDNFLITDEYDLELIENLPDFLGISDIDSDLKPDTHIIELEPLPDRIFLLMLRGSLLVPVNGDIDELTDQIERISFKEF